MEALLKINYLQNISELTLFQKLLTYVKFSITYLNALFVINNNPLNFSWRDVNVEERSEKFQELLKLVRFPIMNQKEFAEFVVPSGVLSKDEMLEIFVHFSGKG